MTAADGTPIWFELTTPDRDRARDFYARVMAWQMFESPMPEHGGYVLAGPAATDAVAGLMTPPPGGGHPGWTIYLATRNVDAAVAQVADLGGTTLAGPMDIPHVGRFAMVADPQGVAFTLLTGASDQPATAFSQQPGARGHGVWIELATPDPAGAFAFYGALFGWEKAGAMPMGPMGDYSFIGAGEARPGAIMSSTTTGAPARWNWYVHVADIDTAVATAADAGGTLIQGPDEIPGGDFSANLLDPDGAQIGIVGPRAKEG
jgi:predicted enzyme related to lactoylglutathione lyase